MTVVGVDLGKTSLRARIVTDAQPIEVAGAGAAGLAEVGAVAALVERVSADLGQALRQAGIGDVQRIVVGAPGVEAAPEAAGQAARVLAEAVSASEAVVVSDSVTAHAGALGGRPGVVLSAGTGAVVLAIDHDGQRRQFDGWGQWLGDDGSGAWIGRAALRAALLDGEQRGGSARLRAAAERQFGPMSHVPAALAAQGNPGGAMAAFVPAVVEVARQGDEVASQILSEAARLLADTVLAAVRVTGLTEVAMVGGLVEIRELSEILLAQVRDECELVPDPGTGLDGACLLATDDGLAHLRGAAHWRNP